jgi:hypothetical protein
MGVGADRGLRHRGERIVIPKSFVRAATMLDLLVVIKAMRATMRGQNELHAFSVMSGELVDDAYAAGLMRCSRDVVALVAAENVDRALVVAGFIPQRPGVARTWMLATDEAWEKYGKELTIYTERGIALQLESRLHRVETVCLDSHTAAKAWYPRLGLKQEATLAKFCTDGSDAALFVRLRGDK